MQFVLIILYIIKIWRFKVLLSLGENALFWPQLIFGIFKLRPSIIHVHGYRHPHTLFALFAGKLIGSKVILTTHAPFNKDPRQKIHLKIFSFLFLLLINTYRTFISPLLPPRCRYTPTCSDYSMQAIQKYGALKGGWLALKRILSCHPWGGHGYDPVP